MTAIDSAGRRSAVGWAQACRNRPSWTPTTKRHGTGNPPLALRVGAIPRARPHGWEGSVRRAGLALVAALLVTSSATAADGGQQAYVTADPGRSDRVGLATQDGRYALVLGEGGDGVVPGVNVLMSTDDA